jgi:hypothetical protein
MKTYTDLITDYLAAGGTITTLPTPTTQPSLTAGATLGDTPLIGLGMDFATVAIPSVDDTTGEIIWASTWADAMDVATTNFLMDYVAKHSPDFAAELAALRKTKTIKSKYGVSKSRHAKTRSIPTPPSKQSKA